MYLQSLQEEVHKLHLALNEERKVTEKLSRNLELEKRRSESLEQKAKNAFRKSGLSDIGYEVSSATTFLLCVIFQMDLDLASRGTRYNIIAALD